MTKAQLKFGKLTAGPLIEQLQAKGDIELRGATLPIPPLDVLNQGMRIQIVDLGAGNTVILDHYDPGGAVPNACGPKDGWKTNTPLTSQKFANKTNAIPTGMRRRLGARHRQGAGAGQDRQAEGRQVQGEGQERHLWPGDGPFRTEIVLGGVAEGLAGQCAAHTFAPIDCTLNGSGATLKCKQP